MSSQRTRASADLLDHARLKHSQFEAMRLSSVSTYGRRAAIHFALATSLLARAYGNDGYGELGLGGVVTLGKTYAVFMRKETLEVSAEKIRVEYVFERNITYPEKVIPVMFPLPLYGPATESWSWAGAPQGFNVTVNGQRRPFKTVVKARSGFCEDGSSHRLCGRDVTSTLKAAGLSDEQIALHSDGSPFVSVEGHPTNAPALTASQKQRLQRDNLYRPDHSDWPGPNWLADVTYVWDMAFDGRKTIDVAHEYVPFTSGGAQAAYFTENELRNDYCADDPVVAAWQRLAEAASEDARVYGPVPGRRLEYILTTARSWAGGRISDFTLRLRKKNPKELVLLCFPGKVRKLDPLTLEMKLKDFEPRSELRVLFLNVDASDSNDEDRKRGVAPVINR